MSLYLPWCSEWYRSITSINFGGIGNQYSAFPVKTSRNNLIIIAPWNDMVFYSRSIWLKVLTTSTVLWGNKKKQFFRFVLVHALSIVQPKFCLEIYSIYIHILFLFETACQDALPTTVFFWLSLVFIICLNANKNWMPFLQDIFYSLNAWLFFSPVKSKNWRKRNLVGITVWHALSNKKTTYIEWAWPRNSFWKMRYVWPSFG